MANRTEDSAMTNLRELMSIENQRAEQEQASRAEAERSRVRRAAEERARIEELSRKRALEAEAARMDDEKIRRAAEEQVESDRLARELRLRLELEQKARLDAQSADLARRERLAAMAAEASRGRGVSTGAAFAMITLAIAVIGVVGFVLHQQSAVRADIASIPAVAPSSHASIPNNADLITAIRNANDRFNAAHSQTPAPVAARPNTPANTGHGHTHRPANPAVNPGNSPDHDLDHLLEGGSDPITGTGLEGGGRRGGRR